MDDPRGGDALPMKKIRKDFLVYSRHGDSGMNKFRLELWKDVALYWIL